ncbi:MAG: hypothetical protein RLZ55_1696 [Actinomycetota bacterium]
MHGRLFPRPDTFHAATTPTRRHRKPARARPPRSPGPKGADGQQSLTVDAPGTGDCEARIEPWGQPVLALSSGAYIAAGVYLVWWARGRADVHRGELWLFAAGLAAAGLGSMDYHGPAVGPEPLLHDGGLAIALAVAFGIDLRRLGAGRRTLWGLGIGTGILLALIAAQPTWSPAVAGVAAVGLVAAETAVYRRGLRRFGRPLAVAAGLLAAGAAVFALSRTGGPLCRPDSLLQGHAFWHVATAAALAAWGVSALPDAGRGGAPRGRRSTPEDLSDGAHRLPT